MEPLQNYCLRWNNYQTNLVKVFDEMLKNENFTDVTIVTENGARFKCHKMILAACSKFFEEIFMNVPSEPHLVVLLKDVKSNDMSHILEYMYTGQVNVEQSRLTSIIRTAEDLQIKGLTGEDKLTKPEDDTMDDGHPSRSPSNHVQTVMHSSNMHSPPHSTNSMYKNPYSNIYSKVHPNDRSNMNLPMWHVPGLPLPTHQPTLENSSPNHFSGPSPPTMMSAYEQPSSEVYHHRRKKFSSVMMPKDTPILRTVLGQGQDLSQPVSLVVNHADVKEENTDQDIKKHMRTEEHPEDNQSSNDCHTEEDAKPRIIVPSSSPLSFTHDMRLVSGIANYIPVRKPESNKRYKQYSNHDLNGALEDVRSGMSALMAAKKHKVPSRTLYDKVKKLGIKNENGNGKPARRLQSTDYITPDDQSDSPRRMSESEDFLLNNNASVTKAFLQHAGEDALKAMALAAAAQVIQKSNRGYSSNEPLSPQMRFMPYNRLSSRCSADSDNHSESPQREKDHDEDQVEDLSMNRRQEGVIVPPMNQVSAIINEEAQRERNDDSRRNHMKEEPIDVASSPYSDLHSTNGDDFKSNIAQSGHSFPNDTRTIPSEIANYVPNQKPEWKRYKQYSRENLTSAIKAVAHRNMSALQAAKKYNVPSRTLYDKIKKLGITTTRSIKRGVNGNYRYLMENQKRSPYYISENEDASINNNSTSFLQQVIDNQGEDALKAMAIVAAYHVSSPPNGSHSPDFLRYIQQQIQHRSPPVEDDQVSNYNNGRSERERDHNEDQVEDLSLNKRQEGVIVSPMHQVSAIIKTEDVARETIEEPMQKSCVTEAE